MTQAKETPPPAESRIGFPEFVMLIAGMMAMTALSLDMMLPALPGIAGAFQLSDPNAAQLVIIIYLFGFSAGHLYAGPLSDRLGRKPVLMGGLVVYAVGSLMAAAAPSFEVLLVGRVIQGLGAAAPRVVAIAVVRDRYAGRGMSRVMSFVMMVFIIVPVLAPTLGSGMMLLGPWRWIFAFLVTFGAALSLWAALRLEETCPPGPPVRLLTAVRTMATTRQSVGYTLALGFMFGSLMTYVSTAEQVFTQVYGMGQEFTLLFGAIALAIVAASFSNSRIVERLGMRRVSHAALVGFLVLCGLMAAFGYPAHPPLFIYALFCFGTFFCFGHIAPNFNALAMDPLGRLAGVGSSLIGFWMMAAGGGFAGLVGQQFDGTIRPITLGFTVLTLCALATVLITERGRLFQVGEGG
ncbi:multidrug effflux MFS transporter [Rhodovibrio salinarum]|uniref:Bcr/CflA family efflux transporter n=1 Tax=Rhodovibrio salinarum TaxID=1087 RepID=A0A934V0H7_9PROT|nr:multidrug effflux MFS transporter [Rhodovibrio salinarum]MBK1697420.1 Bcr/CflA family drug resistance efflux transporter [Rhodovibrio salinarum]